MSKSPLLAGPVSTLFGVGAERVVQLARLEVQTIEDLLLLRPRRYEDRRHFRRISELQLDEPASTSGKIVAMGTKWFKQHTKSVFEIVLEDGTARLHCRWWNLPFMEKYFAVGQEVVVFGKPVTLKPRTIDHPETEVIEGGEESVIHLNRITPIYPLTEGLPQRWLRSLIWRTLAGFENQIGESPVSSFEFWVSSPEQVGSQSDKSGPLTPALSPSEGEREKTSNSRQGTAVLPLPLRGGEGRGEGGQVTSAAHKGPGQESKLETPNSKLEIPSSFLSRARAVHLLHAPEKLEDIEQARRRLALDEFVALQLQIQRRRRTFESKALALPCAGDNRFIKPFLARLGFKLTDAQTAVLRELRKDLSGVHPMRRLLQGDVGSGKTVVAACCALMCLESGYNVALMAPTEILTEQHFLNFKKWFEALNIPVELRTGSHKTGSNEWRVASDAVSRVPSSRVTRHASLVIGTHALLTEGFEVPNLGLVVIDEQHKFGVSQREQLLRKGHYPHLLVMTATPIPRTLGLTLYGDLDVSVIDKMPPGRGRIETFVRTADKLPKVWDFIRSQLKEGRQAYVIYARVEESGLNVKAVTKELETVRQALAPHQVELIHGRLNSREKEAVMARFRSNAVQALLATSLVEVGVDVPNATVMLIENAEQFGLAQLHQLRGRIGRGAGQSYCILLAAAKTTEARQRLSALEATTDGFRIAETDLKLRGPGELLGQQQSGAPRFRFGDLAGDLELIELARSMAARMVKEG